MRRLYAILISIIVVTVAVALWLGRMHGCAS